MTAHLTPGWQAAIKCLLDDMDSEQGAADLCAARGDAESASAHRVKASGVLTSVLLLVRRGSELGVAPYDDGLAPGWSECIKAICGEAEKSEQPRAGWFASVAKWAASTAFELDILDKPDPE